MTTQPIGNSCRIPALVVMMIVSATPSVAQQRQPANPAEQLGALLEGVFKAWAPAPKPAPRRPVAAFAEAMEVAAPVRAEDSVMRLKRLQRHAAVLQDWMGLHADLSDEQNQQFAAELNTKIADLQKNWKAAGAPQLRRRNSRQLEDFFPICFTEADGPASALQNMELDTIEIPAEQQDKLQKAISNRQQRLRSAAQGYVVNLLDEKFFLTPEQREKMSQLVAKRVDLDATCFSLDDSQNYGQYFQQASVNQSAAAWKAENVLTEKQRQLFESAGEQMPNQHLMISTGADEDTLRTQLQDASKTQRVRMSRHLAVRIDFFQATGSISKKDAFRLRVAGKGAAEDMIETWKKSVQDTVKRFREQNQMRPNVQFGMSMPSHQQVLKNELWSHTVSSLVKDTSGAVKARNDAIQEAKAKFVLAMMDRELLLEPFQRERLLKSVRKILPPADYIDPYRQGFNEISLLCIALFKLSKLDMTLLSPKQREVWEAMKEPFDVQNGYVLVPTKMGGNLHLGMPK